MNKFLLFFLCTWVCFSVINAQEKTKSKPQVIIKGKVLNYTWREFLYYTDDLLKINPKNKIKIGKNGTYVFQINKTGFKNSDIIFFVQDTLSSEVIKYACYDEINFKAINTYCEKNKKVALTLYNDLEVTLNCSVTAGADFSKLERQLGGNYTYRNRDTVLQLNLSTIGLAFLSGTITPLGKNLFDHLWGGWSLNEEKMELSLYSNYYYNKEFSTMQQVHAHWKFKVTPKDNQFSFSPITGKGILTKNE